MDRGYSLDLFDLTSYLVFKWNKIAGWLRDKNSRRYNKVYTYWPKLYNENVIFAFLYDTFKLFSSISDTPSSLLNSSITS